MFQRLCSTSTWKVVGIIPNTSNFIFSCSSELHAQHKCFHNSRVLDLLAQHKYKHSCAPELLTQYKHQVSMCSRAPCSTQNISSIMCFRVHAQHIKSFIKHMSLAYAQYIKQIIMFISIGVLVPIYQLNIKVTS